MGMNNVIIDKKQDDCYNNLVISCWVYEKRYDQFMERIQILKSYGFSDIYEIYICPRTNSVIFEYEIYLTAYNDVEYENMVERLSKAGDWHSFREKNSVYFVWGDHNFRMKICITQRWEKIGES